MNVMSLYFLDFRAASISDRGTVPPKGALSSSTTAPYVRRLPPIVNAWVIVPNENRHIPIGEAVSKVAAVQD